MKISPWFVGEFVGTFLIVFFGCGSVCAAVLTGAQMGIFQVAIVWGIGIAVGRFREEVSAWVFTLPGRSSLYGSFGSARRFWVGFGGF